MARTKINVTSLTVNATSTTYGSFILLASTDFNYIEVSDPSKLVFGIYNSDTAVCTVTIQGSSNVSWVGSGWSDLSTSVASSEIRLFGPFEGVKFKSTSGQIWIDSTSTAVAKTRMFACLLP